MPRIDTHLDTGLGISHVYLDIGQNHGDDGTWMQEISMYRQSSNGARPVAIDFSVTGEQCQHNMIVSLSADEAIRVAHALMDLALGER